MPDIRASWVNVLAAVVGGVALGVGVARILLEPSLLALLWALIGFLLLGWAVFDRRKFRRGTPESEVSVRRATMCGR